MLKTKNFNRKLQLLYLPIEIFTNRIFIFQNQIITFERKLEDTMIYAPLPGRDR